MARIFTDGAEMGHILGWDNWGYSPTASTAQKRTGDYSYAFDQGDSLVKMLGSITEVFIRQAIRLNGWGNTRIIEVKNGINILDSLAMDEQTHLLKAYSGASQTLLQAGTIPLSLNTWYLIEARIKIGDAPNGIFQVKVDGVLDIDYTGDTKPGSETTMTDYVICSNAGNMSFYADDIAVNDTTGGADDSWCGDGHVILLKLNANGDVSQLMGSDGNQTDNYLLVDEVPADNDTTYVEGSTVDERDLYNLAPCGLSNVDILRVQALAVARDTVAAGGKVALVVKTNSTEYAGSDESLLTTYTEVRGAAYKLNPNTSSAWSISDLDALQVGPKTR